MFRLIHGECLEEMKKIPDNYIDLTITSPPYDNIRNYENNISQWNEEKWKNIIKELYRITKENKTIVWIVNDAIINGSRTGTSFKQALWGISCGLNLHDVMIWEKPGFSNVGSLTRYPSTFEYMFIFTKGKIQTFNLLKDKKVKNKNSKITGTIRQKDGTTKPMWSIGKISGKNGYGIRHNIWKINPQITKGHPAPFPLKLAYDHIISWSNKNDLIFDPFMGSGTTGLACLQSHRNFIGIEIEEKYFKIAQKRINNNRGLLYDV